MNYQKVPNMISGKDLDYLSDMFIWNYGALKRTNANIPNVQDETIKETLKKGCKLFENNIQEILTILGGANE